MTIDPFNSLNNLKPTRTVRTPAKSISVDGKPKNAIMFGIASDKADSTAADQRVALERINDAGGKAITDVVHHVALIFFP